MSTNLEYSARERQRNKENRRQASEVQREKERQRRHFLLGEQHENFVAAVFWANYILLSRASLLALAKSIYYLKTKCYITDLHFRTNT